MKFNIDPEVLASLEGQSLADAQVLLSELEEVRRQNPLTFYAPHPKQIVFHSSRATLKAFLGGNRSGKTTAGVVDDLVQALDADWVPDHLKAFKRWQPPFYCRLVLPDLTNTLEGVVLQKIREWCPPSQLQGGSVGQAYDKVLRKLSFKNGSWFQFFSNDQELDKFGGAALHRAHYDEETREDIRRECLMRLIDFGGEELMTMTPLQGMSWTFSEVFEPWEKAGGDDGQPTVDVNGYPLTVVTVDIDDNPYLDETTRDRVLASFTGEEREARKSGRFVHFAGLVFSEFSRSHHVEPSTTLPVPVKVFVGIDPGMRHMAAAVWCYLDADDRMVVFDELAMQGAVVREVCEAIAHKNLKWKIDPDWYVIDPASRNKNPQTGRSDQDAYADHHIFAFPGQNQVRPGINAVKERLLNDRLVVSAQCPELISEFRKYRWSSPSRSESDARETVVKKDDHLLDALRYVCMAKPMRPLHDQLSATATFKDRLLRHQLELIGQGRQVDHPVGPGVFA